MYQEKILFRIGRHTFNFWQSLAPNDRHVGCPYCNYSGCEYTKTGYKGHLIWTLTLLKRTIKGRIKQWVKNLTALDYSKIDNIEVDGIDTRDYPDFCDAFISYAEYKGKPMTESQLERLNEDHSFVYDCVIERLF